MNSEMAGLVHSRLWCVLIVGLLAVCSPIPSEATEYLQPTNPKVLVDSYLVLTCTVRKLSENCTSSDLEFTKDGVQISDEFVTPVNQSVSQLNLSTAGWNKGDHTVLCFQRCYLPKLFIGSQNVVVIGLWPIDPEVLIGTRLNMICYLPVGCNAHQVLFKYGHVTVDKKFVTIVDESEVRLSMPVTKMGSRYGTRIRCDHHCGSSGDYGFDQLLTVIDRGLWPIDPVVLIGTRLNMTCYMPVGCNARKVLFEYGRVTVDKRFVNTVDDSEVRLSMPVTKRGSKHGTRIRCNHQCGSSGDYRFEQLLTVIERLVKPNITGCIVYNWERMVCSWEPKFQDPGVPTTQKLLWYIAWPPCYIDAGSPEHERLSEYHIVFYEDCPRASNRSCEFGHDTYSFFEVSVYYLLVEASNEFEEVDSREDPLYSVQPNETVKPNQVKGLSGISETSSSVVITWQAPAPHKIGLRYWIRYKSTEFETGWKYTFLNTTHVENHLNKTLEDLIPNAKYKIKVLCHPQEEGFWSDPSETSVVTLADVPGAAPPVTDGSFVIGPKSDPERQGILIYWQPIPKMMWHGKLEYEVKILGSKATCKQQHDRSQTGNYCSVNLRKNVPHSVTIQGKTEKGVNSSLSLKSIYIEKEEKRPLVPKEHYFIKNNSVITLYWKKPDVYSVTAYWCKSNDHLICLDDIKWSTAYGSNGSLSFVPQNKSQLNLGLAISAQELRDGRIVSSGMEWSECLYYQDKAPGAPVDLQVSKEQQDGSLTVEWEAPNCKTAELGYSAEYVLEYCKVEECANEDIEPKTITVAGLNKTGTIPNLEPYSKYQVQIHAVSPSGMESQSVKIEGVVKKSGLTKSQVAGVVVGVIFIGCLIVAGCFTIIKHCKKVYKRYMDLQYDLPDDLPFEVTETNDYGDTGIMENGIMVDGGPTSNRHGDGYSRDIGREITQSSVIPHQVNGVRSLDSGDTVHMEHIATSLIRKLQHQNKPTPESVPMSDSKTQEPDHHIPCIPPPKESGSPKVSPATSRQNSSIPAYTAITEMPDGSPHSLNVITKQSAYLSPRNLNNGNNNRESGSSSVGSASTENDTSMNSMATYSKVAAPSSDAVEPSAEGTPFSSTESKTSLLGDSHLRKGSTDKPAANRSSLQQTQLAQPVDPSASVANPTSISDSNLHNPKTVTAGLDHGYSTGSQMSGDSTADYVPNKEIKPVADTKQPNTGTVCAEKDMGYCTDKDLIDSGIGSRDVCNNVKTKAESETGTNVASPTGVSGYITEEMLELGAPSTSVTV